MKKHVLYDHADTLIRSDLDSLMLLLRYDSGLYDAGNV
jgi:hypothetical protein